MVMFVLRDALLRLTYRDRQINRLKDRLLLETRYKLQKARYEVLRKRRGQYYSQEDRVSCILHLELRVGEMLVAMAVKQAMATAVDSEPVAGKKRKETIQAEFLADLNATIQTAVLNTGAHRSSWSISLSHDDKSTMPTIKPISLSKQQAVAFMEQSETFLAACFPHDQDKAATLNESLREYLTAMKILKKREDYTLDEINSFQEHIDKWFALWIKEFGRDTYSNYIHLLHSGHIAEEMRTFGCLYRYSQEGLEAMNALIKSFWFRRTGRGGGKPTGEQSSNRILPIARWSQRRMCWMFLSMAEREIQNGNYVESEGGDCPVWHSVRKDFEELRGEAGRKGDDRATTEDTEELLDSISDEIMQSDNEEEENMEEDELVDVPEDNMLSDDDCVEINGGDQQEEEKDEEYEDDGGESDGDWME